MEYVAVFYNKFVMGPNIRRARMWSTTYLVMNGAHVSIYIE